MDSTWKIFVPYMLGKSPHASFRFNNLTKHMQRIEGMKSDNSTH
jgi:hypothetical protein